jgi:hypothetical protein
VVPRASFILLATAIAIGCATGGSRLEVHPPGAIYDSRLLEDLPSGLTPWSLLETAEASAITDEVDGGGIRAASPALIGARSVSWVDTTYTFDGHDITDPFQGGMPLLPVPIEFVDRLQFVTAMLPLDAGASGGLVAMTGPAPRELGWHGRLRTSISASSTPGGQPPPLARLDSLVLGSIHLAGTDDAERWRLAIDAGVTEGKVSRRGGSLLTARQTTMAAHGSLALSADDRVTGSVVAGRTSDASASDLPAAHDSTHVGVFGRWTRGSSVRTRWSAGGSLQHAGMERRPEADRGAFERLLDGPAPSILTDPGRSTSRVQLEAKRTLVFDEAASGGHEVSVGAAVDHARATVHWPESVALIGETRGGVAARAWRLGVGRSSPRTSTTITGYAGDRWRLGDTVVLDAGLRVQHARFSAREGFALESFHVSPRVRAWWRPRGLERLTLFGGIGQDPRAWPLSLLSFGDAASPSVGIHRWSDANGDRVVQGAELGPLVAVGGAEGRAAIDSNLQRPSTRELALGATLRLGGPWAVHVLGLHRRDTAILGVVDLAASPASYVVRRIPDPGGDLLSPEDDQLLPAYDRLPASFGSENLLLSNPSGRAPVFEGLEITFERHDPDRWWLRLGATAARGLGPASNRGFGPLENVVHLPGETFADPNALTNARGRLFFDRAYTIKLATTVRGPRRVDIGVVARYLDGQPFARLVRIDDLNQGPELVRAVPNGRHRFTYIMTVDARLARRFETRAGALALALEAFNLFDQRSSVEEHVLSDAEFRRSTAVQPPRVLRLGMAFEF